MKYLAILILLISNNANLRAEIRIQHSLFERCLFGNIFLEGNFLYRKSDTLYFSLKEYNSSTSHRDTFYDLNYFRDHYDDCDSYIDSLLNFKSCYNVWDSDYLIIEAYKLEGIELKRVNYNLKVDNNIIFENNIGDNRFFFRSNNIFWKEYLENLNNCINKCQEINQIINRSIQTEKNNELINWVLKNECIFNGSCQDHNLTISFYNTIILNHLFISGAIKKNWEAILLLNHLNIKSSLFHFSYTTNISPFNSYSDIKFLIKIISNVKYSTFTRSICIEFLNNSILNNFAFSNENSLQSAYKPINYNRKVKFIRSKMLQLLLDNKIQDLSPVIFGTLSFNQEKHLIRSPNIDFINQLS